MVVVSVLFFFFFFGFYSCQCGSGVLLVANELRVNQQAGSERHACLCGRGSQGERGRVRGLTGESCGVARE